jgi:hypothetical protein
MDTPFQVHVMDMEGKSLILTFTDHATAEAAFDALRYSMNVMRLDLVERMPQGAVNRQRFHRTGVVIGQSNVKRRD